MVTAGHGSYEMTMQQYGKVMPGALDEASDKFADYMARGSAGQRRDNAGFMPAVERALHSGTSPA